MNNFWKSHSIVVMCFAGFAVLAFFVSSLNEKKDILSNNDNMTFDKLVHQDNIIVRWKFKGEAKGEEKRIQQKITKDIDLWWEAFEKVQDKIDRSFVTGEEFDLIQFMDNNLNVLNENIFWEFGSAINKSGHRLIITPESNKHLRPFVNEILKRAPHLDRWEFYGYRLKEDFNMVNSYLKERTGGTIANLEFQVSKNLYNSIDFYFSNKFCKSKEDIDQSYNDAFVALELILGEENLDKWVGIIEIDSNKKEGIEVYGMEDLNRVFNETLEEIKSEIFSEPHFSISNTVDWSLLKLDPEKKNDYVNQEDIFVAKAINMPMWQTAHSNELFYSERFSKQEEIFCYVKLDGTDGLERSTFEDKSSIEDALDSALIKKKIGCFIGGGTGLKYSYIDLALKDLDSGIKVIKDVLQKGGITRKAWVLFYDSELRHEWVGIWDDSPRPFLPSFD